MTSPPATAPAVIDADLACAICGYNLKGLSPDGTCPECGQAVARTFQFGLTAADPAWLRRQAATMPMLGALLLLNSPPGQMMSTQWVGYALNLALALANVWACFRLSARDPADPDDRYGTARRGVQLASVVLALVLAYQITLGDGMSQWSGQGPIAYAHGAALAANDAFALFLITRLARRAADKSLYAHATWAMWSFSSIHPTYLMLYALDLRPIAEAMAYFMAVYFYFTHAALFLTLILLGRMWEALRAAAATADARAAAPAPVLISSPHP